MFRSLLYTTQSRILRGSEELQKDERFSVNSALKHNVALIPLWCSKTISLELSALRWTVLVFW